MDIGTQARQSFEMDVIEITKRIVELQTLEIQDRLSAIADGADIRVVQRGDNVMNADSMGAIALPEAVRALVVAHCALVASYATTNLRFTLDGRLVGDIAEAIAADAFGLKLCRVRTAGVDSLTHDDRTVQVKSSAIGKGPAFTPGEGRADHLIFLSLDFAKGEALVQYNGPEAIVRAELPPGFTGTKRVSMPRIRALDALVEDGPTLI